MINDYNLKNLKKISLKNRDLRMYVAPRYLHHYVDNEYEEFAADIICQYAESGLTFVDVGAHYGFYSLLIARSIPKSKVIAIEPVDENFEVLKKNIELNKFKNISAYKLAASDKEGIKKLQITEASDSCGFYGHPLTKTVEVRKIKTVYLDKFLKNQKVDILKIDVEGHEMVVLEGAKSILKNKNVKLLIEFNPKTLKKAGKKPEELLSKLRAFNFDIFLINDKGRQIYRITKNLSPWKKILKKSEYANLFCLKKEKSLLVTFFSHSSGLLGAERSMLQRIEELKKRKVFVNVILPGSGPMVSELRKIKIPHKIIPYTWWCESIKKEKSFLIKKHAHNLECLMEILNYLKLTNPHVIFTRTVTIPWGGLVGKILGIPHVWHISEFGKEDHSFVFDVGFDNSCHFINDHSERIIANSKAVAKNLGRYIPKNRIFVSYYNIRLESDNSDRLKEFFKKKNSLKLIMVGAISPGKNQREAILAAKELKRKKINFELVILGPSHFPDYLKKLKMLILRYNLEDFIRIVGPVKNAGLYMRQADVVLVCSKMEAFGRVTVEAMLCKKPVVGSKSGGTIELIKNGYNGLLYSPGDYKELAEKIVYLYRNRQKISELGQNGYKFAEKKFGEEYSGKIYNILMKSKNKPKKGNKFYSMLQMSFLRLPEMKLKEKGKIVRDQEKEIESLQQILDNITSAKTFRAWQAFVRTRKRIYNSLGIKRG